jgi:hypothetical protein
MRKGEPSVEFEDPLVTLAIRIQEKKKKWRRDSRSLKAAREMGRLAACLDPQPAIVRPSVGSVPFNRDSLSYQFRSVQALQPLLMETCKSRVIIKTCTKSWVRVGQFLGIHSMKWPLGLQMEDPKESLLKRVSTSSEHWWKLLSLVSRPVPALCILVTLGEAWITGWRKAGRALPHAAIHRKPGTATRLASPILH